MSDDAELIEARDTFSVVRTITVTDAESFEFADAVLCDVHTRKSEAVRDKNFEIADVYNTAAQHLTNAIDIYRGVQPRWYIKRITIDLLEERFKCPDMAAIEREAREQGISGNEPPVIAGVIFERI